MNIVGHKYFYLIFSGILVVASILAFVLWGLNLGIDFTGGSLLEVTFDPAPPSVLDIQQTLSSLNLGDILIQPAGGSGVFLRFQHVDEQSHQRILQELSAIKNVKGVKEQRFDTIGPIIGKELQQNSLIAIFVALFAIAAYIGLAFRKVSKPIASWKYGVIAAIVAVLHDVAIPAGAFIALGHFKNVPIDSLFITALLTILGFSVHDTIVVFDRIRENLKKLKTTEPFEKTVNRSVNETMARSINTSLSVLFVLLVILFLGGESTQYFAFALILGIIFGTYSSIFIASPLLVIWEQFDAKRAGKNRAS